MDQSEIVRSYREAKNKEKQIQILADLNGSSPEQIRQILIAAGEPAEDEEIPDLPDADPIEAKEAQIDLSGVEWDVDGLNDPQTSKESGEEQTEHHRRHKKWF